MFHRLIATAIVYYVTSMSLVAQVTFIGPKEGTPGKLNTVVVDAKGDDFKLIILQDGKPAAQEDYLSLRDDEGRRVILITSEKPGVFTFFGATNLDKKTFTGVHTLTLGKPRPVEPDPVMPNNDLTGRLKPKYNVSPDTAALEKLIVMFEEASKEKYPNFDAAEADLARVGKKFLNDTDLRAVRDEISKYLIEKHGTDPRVRKVADLQKTYLDIATALKGLR